MLVSDALAFDMNELHDNARLKYMQLPAGRGTITLELRESQDNEMVRLGSKMEGPGYEQV